MSLADLRDVLQAQLEDRHAITVRAATLAQAGLAPRTGMDALLRGHLVLGEMDLTVSYSGQVPPPTGDSLTLTGSAALLGAQSATVTVTFLAPADGPADVRVAVSLPDRWTLGTSFPALGRPPFDELIMTDSRYLVTTLPRDAYTWNGTAYPLVAGAHLLSLVALEGPLALVAALLAEGAATGPVPLTGMVDPSGLSSAGAGIPALALTAPLSGGIDVRQLFSLSQPRIELTTAPAPEAGLLVWLAFTATLSADDTPVCDFSAFASSGATDVTFTMSPHDPSTPPRLTPEAMRSLVHVDYHSTVPQELSGLFNAVTLKALGTTISLDSFQLKRVVASIGTVQPWRYGQFTLEELSLDLMALAPVGGGGPLLVSFSARAVLFPEVIDGAFEVEATYDVASGDVCVGAGFTGDIKLSKVVKGLSENRVTLPDELEMTFSDFGAVLHKPSGGTVGYTFYGSVDTAVTLPFLGTELEAGLEVVVDSAARSYQLLGSLTIGYSAFSVAVDLTAGQKLVTGRWQPVHTGDSLGFADVAEAAGIAAPAVPEGLDLGLKSAELSYDITNKVLALEAESAAYGKAAIVAGRGASGEWGLAFAVLPEIAVTLDLSTIDVIGKLVPSGDDIISLSGLRIVGATSPVPEHLPPDAAAIIGAVSNSGLVLSAELKAGTAVDQTVTVRFGGTEQDGPPSTAIAVPTGTVAASALPVIAGPAAAGAAVSPAPQALWINVQRSFGPAHIERVGLTISPPAELTVLLDAAVSVAGLTLGLTGLQASMPIKAPYVPSFDLAGLQVQFSGGGVEISGGMEKVPGKTPAEYTGELTVQLAQFGATMFGSYTTVNGQPSLFAFLLLDAPLGGPAFFFVTGLAGGFGYNRTLQLPDISGVESYPLVAGAMGKLDANATQQELDHYIQPAQNQNWLAAGVHFTSFEMVSSFALLTVAFGAQVEIALLGESTISVPAPAEGETVNPVAQAVMVLLVDIAPANGQLAVCAQLTPESYVLDRAAHLTGGFAFYSWFAPSGQAGDFVITLGGYNPYFDPPPHYPRQVPRLGLSWQPPPGQLSVSGGLYFALTPSALMAGGYLKATWESGDISAWFDAQADFLMRFKPFQYLVTTSISLGASITLNLLVTSIRLTLSIGADLALWGPPFGGTAVVHLSIISFTIGFGAPRPETLPELSWEQFRQSFLPPVNSSRQHRGARAPLAAAAPGAPPATTTDSLITVSSAQGLLGIVKDGDTEVWLVSPGTLRIAVATQLPSTTASVVPSTTITPSGSWTGQLGVGPMGAGPGTLSAALRIAIDHDQEPAPGAWTAVAVTGGVPKGLYQNTTTQMQSDGMVADALLGVTLAPARPAAGSSVTVPVAALLPGDPVVRDFGWSPAVPPASDGFDQHTALAQLQSSLVDPAVTEVRGGLLAVLRGYGLDVSASVDVSGFAARASSMMAAPPQLRLLGEQVPPAAPPVTAEGGRR